MLNVLSMLNLYHHQTKQKYRVQRELFGEKNLWFSSQKHFEKWNQLLK